MPPKNTNYSSHPLPQEPSQSYSPPENNQPSRPSNLAAVSFSETDKYNLPRGPNGPNRPQLSATYSSKGPQKSYSNDDGSVQLDESAAPILYADAGAYATGGGADFKKKKSLIRPDRERVDPGDRLFHYRQHAKNQTDVMASATGNLPDPTAVHNNRAAPQLRRGKSILAREVTNVSTRTSFVEETPIIGYEKKSGFWDRIAPGPVDGWMIYCWILTCWVPPFIMRYVFGKRTPEAQRAWREKIGLIGIIASLMAAVGFLTFGFTQAVCGTPANRYHGGHIQNGSLIMNGYSYDLSKWNHPAGGVFNGSQNPLYMDAWMAGGMDASFLFQDVNRRCLNIIKPTNNTGISVDPANRNRMGWYFPCKLRPQNGTDTVDASNITSSYTCHTAASARNGYNSLKPAGQVYYSWSDVKNPKRNLAVYQSNVLDLDLLNWLQSSQTTWPPLFDHLRSKNVSYQGLDITMVGIRAGQKAEMNCLMDVITIGFIDTKTIGCVASDVVLYVSLVFIIGVVGAKFAMALLFGWFLSWKLGNFKGETYAQRMARSEAIENWTDDIYRAAPSKYRPNVASGKGGKSKGTTFLPSTSRFSKADSMMVTASRPTTAYGSGSPNGGYTRSNTASSYGAKGLLSTGRYTPPGSPMLHSSRSSNSLPFGGDSSNVHHSFSDASLAQANCPFPFNPNVIPQPSIDYEPFGFPLIHNILLVTAYSESIEGLRTTIDSLATTDYPNSHKVILVIADGMVRGSGSALKTPDIVLGMMKDLVIPADQVEAHSYVAIADGHKRHNMAKVYAGFYDYDDDTVELSKQQRVPIVLVAKVGNPLEANDAKPGNRGKRDSQIVLMAFLQKVMFDERMTTFEYEFFNSLWRVTGVSPDRYEGVLCVDADTKVFPDSLTRMTAALQSDGDIMGLCGETKIANKSETWVTMIQVFEYYISHHQTKAFEAVFGGVTCLPGCFSMYRIKAPKGDSGYWVPIMANPDIVEHYSENVVDTLHKKNLLLLGEDRYLSTLMLKTFPKRKMVFIPQAVCKTVVPDTFRVLLSQRRRWINSTIHNLFELLFVNDLCGTFCFSMQFVVFMELVGTLVLPAAIAFTLYIIIIAIIPGQVTPTLSLILLAIILGLPGILIVVTSRKIAYVGWMLIYLFSLPIWNFVLPTYAYWHFDDFSWGETRKVESDGPKKEEVGHGDKDGEFDSSNIVMKRWAEFERERRWKSGTSSPRRLETRYSIASTMENYENYHYHGGRPSASQTSGLIDGLITPGGASSDSYHSNSTGPFQDHHSHSSHHSELASPGEYEGELGLEEGSSRLGVTLHDQGYTPQPAQPQDRVRRIARNAQKRQSGGYGPTSMSNVAVPPSSGPNGGGNAAGSSGGYARFDRSQQ